MGTDPTVRTASTELEVHPLGDGRVNREPDLVVLCPEHLELLANIKKSAILLGMPAPAFVAEVVSPGGEGSDNYRRGHEWKRQQYQEVEIPEYWIIGRHRQQVIVLILKDGGYEEILYRSSEAIHSAAFLLDFIDNKRAKMPSRPYAACISDNFTSISKTLTVKGFPLFPIKSIIEPIGYEEILYRSSEASHSAAFLLLSLSAEKVLFAGDI